MASIIDSLFGPTPYDVSQARNTQDMSYAEKVARMGGFEQAKFGIGQGAAGLTRAGAGMMGMVDPLQQEAAMREGVMGMGGDLTTSAGLKAKALQFAQAGDQRTAMKLAIAAKEMEDKESERRLRDAHAKYYENAGSRTSASANNQLATKQAIARNDAMKWALNAGYKGQDLMDFVEAQVQKVTDTWTATTGVQQPTVGATALSPSTEMRTGMEITQEQKDAMIQDASSRGDVEAVAKIQGLPVAKAVALPKSKAEVAGEVELAKTVAANNPEALAKGAAAKEGGKTGIEIQTKNFHAAEAASRLIPKVDALITQLKTGDITTGVGADLRIGISRLQALLGGKEAAKNATDSQIAEVMMGSEVFPLIQSLGVGARGMDTPAERDFMRKVLTGELSLEKGTLLKMAELRKEAAMKDIDRWDSQVDRGELDKYFQNVGIPKTKFGKQQQGPSGQPRRIKFDEKGNRVQ